MKARASPPRFRSATSRASSRPCKRKYGDLADRFLQIYPVANSNDVKDAYLHSLRDEWFTWEMRTWARLTQKAGGKAYLYYFSRVPPRPDAEKYGAYHAAEIAYAFDNLRLLPWKSEPADEALADAISGAWVRFAAAGDPNGGNLATWAAYDPQHENYLELGDPIRPGSAAAASAVRLFRRLYRSPPGAAVALIAHGYELARSHLADKLTCGRYIGSQPIAGHDSRHTRKRSPRPMATCSLLVERRLRLPARSRRHLARQPP